MIPGFCSGRWIRIVYILVFFVSCTTQEQYDFVLLNGKVITVDEEFSIAEALAVKNGRITAVGTNRDIKKLVGDETKIMDAGGRAVIPGIIEAHVHPEAASVSELNEAIPVIYTLDELLEWVRDQAMVKSDGEWIILPKFFYTRLKEFHPPTLDELDQAAPVNPVFLDGSYGGIINSEAMKQLGIASNTTHQGIEKDETTGMPNGIIKGSAVADFKIPRNDSFSKEQRIDALIKLLSEYTRYGITSICSGSGNFDMFEMYKDLNDEEKLPTRVYLNIRLPNVPGQTSEELGTKISDFPYKTGDGNDWVKISALKIALDGGILTGTAFLREPWGEKAGEIYGITDPEYRGVVNYSYDELFSIVSAAASLGWKFTVHCTGGGGVDLLLDVFEEVNKQYPLNERRFSIIHGNFFTPEAIQRMGSLGIYADMQAAWFYKDADVMKEILGEDRIASFLPYKSLIEGGVIVNGGSDHMVKTDANLSINPYNPFLAMWTMITRKTERGSVIQPEEAITREEALKMYTINNAAAFFDESVKGSIEVGKFADFTILSNDILTCPVDEIKDIEAEFTMVGGKIVYSNPTFQE